MLIVVQIIYSTQRERERERDFFFFFQRPPTFATTNSDDFRDGP